MTENDDKLLTAFFAGNRQEIPDNGFTRRVMRHLPDRTHRISQVWVTFTTAAQSGMTELDPKSLLVAGIVLLYLLYRKICSLA